MVLHNTPLNIILLNHLILLLCGKTTTLRLSDYTGTKPNVLYNRKAVLSELQRNINRYALVKCTQRH